MSSKSWIKQKYPIGHKGHFPRPGTNGLEPATVTGYVEEKNGRAAPRVTGVSIVFHLDGKTANIDWVVLNLLQVEGQQIARFVAEALK